MNELEEAIGAYWDCAYQEGHLRRPDGDKANAILSEIRAAVKSLVVAEREACALWLDFYDGKGKSRAESIRNGDHIRSSISVTGARAGTVEE